MNTGDWSFERPWCLQLAAVLLAIGLVSSVILPLVLSRMNRHTAGALLRRSVTLAILALALAGPMRRKVETASGGVVFVIDGAARLGAGFETAHRFVRDSLELLPGETPCGVVVAGREPVWVVPPKTPRSEVRWADSPEFTPATRPGHLGRALKHAIELLPRGGTLVLVTDGRSDRDALAARADEIRERGIGVYLRSIGATPRSGVFIENVTGPRLAREKDLATFHVAIRNTGEEPVAVVLRHALERKGSGAPAEERVETRCPPGTSVVTCDVLLPRPGNAWFHIGLETAASQPREFEPHQQGWSPLTIVPTPDILLVNGREKAAAEVESALREVGAELSEGKLVSIRPDQLPDDPDALERFGAVVLVNVPAADLGTKRVAALRHYVEQTGGGLVVYGGDKAYDMGGYAESEFEKLLPVDSETKHPRRKKLTFGLLFVIDASGSVADAIDGSKLAAGSILQAVPDGSTAGALYFDVQGHPISELVSLSPSVRSGLIGKIHSIRPGGGTALGPALRSAKAMIQRARSAGGKKGLKGHLFVLSDGHIEGDHGTVNGLAADLAREGWRVTCIGVGTGVDEATLKGVASHGGGHYRRYPEIPRIGDPKTPRQPLMYTLLRKRGEPVFRIADASTQVLASLSDYNRTKRLKPWGRTSLEVDADTSTTALAYGVLGRGKSVACLYEVEGYWSRGMLGGANRLRLLAKPVLYALRDANENLHVPGAIRNADGMWVLGIDASDDRAPQLDLVLAQPGEDPAGGLRIRLPRVGSHRYESILPDLEGLRGPFTIGIAPRIGRSGRPIPPATVPAVAWAPPDTEALTQKGEDVAGIDAFLDRSDGARVGGPGELSLASVEVPAPRKTRWWHAALVLAILTAVAADVAGRSHRRRWYLILYAAFGVFTGVAYLAA